MIEELDRMLADAKAGRQISRAINLAEPVDHTADYDRVMAMLEMSVDDTVILSAQEFNQFVLDDWEWSRLASYTNQCYAAGTRVPRPAKQWDDDDYA